MLCIDARAVAFKWIKGTNFVKSTCKCPNMLSRILAMSETDAINIVTINVITACYYVVSSKCIRAAILIGNNLPTYLSISNTMSVESGRGAAWTIKVDSTEAYVMAGK